ncbi:sensor domain-containing protein [Noviherbaspirillum galbum]|uniref:EAL domain-containing protein n=1 Tax=Noviherbaspirillum galbum TaxID=2709383 RepID=A0A6B3SF55_9BURK|nr:EAL domain-containing protein [Noviherbaspirillum galbum]NEX59474.1 EAL domain-containing protein [Noviherbaspirillum galbum]
MHLSTDGSLEAEALRQRLAILEVELQQKSEELAKAQLALSQTAEHQRNVQAELDGFRFDYRTTFDLAAIGIAHLTPEGKWLRVNQFLCDMLGYSQDELVHKNFQELTHPDDLSADLDQVADLLAGKINFYAMEKRYLHRSGAIVWGHLTVSLVRNAAGKPSYFIAVVKNIDLRIRARIAMERSRARLKAVLNSLFEGVIVFSSTGNVLEINPAALELLGYSGITAVSGEPHKLHEAFEVFELNGEQVPVEQWPVSRLLKGESVAAREFIIRRRGTRDAWVGSFSATVVDDIKGEGWLGVLTVRNITQRHLAETGLRVSEERLRMAFDHIPDMVVIYDTALRIQYVNLATLHHTGMDASALLGQVVTDIHPAPSIAMWTPLVHAAVAASSTQTGDIDVPSGGGMRNFGVTCVPICEPSGGVREVLAICHDYTERRQAEEKIRLAALHDPLTGLPNRTLLFEYARHIFAAAKRSRHGVCMMFIDLDQFKPINDIHGHEAGDAVLRQVAARMQECMRGDDTIFRLGGDEFLVLLPNCANDADCEHVARHLMQILCQPYEVGSLELTLSCSIGLSMYPRDGSDVDTLINCADAAMYMAKETGRNNFKFYTPALAERVVTQSIIAERIKQALGRDEFHLHYQPLVDMQTNRVVSVEALLRWPRHGTGPDRFIQVAEATGLIGRIGEWVLSAACRQQSDWQAQGLPVIPIAVNVSASEFRKKNFVDYLESMIERHRINPSSIQIELTETAVMQDIDHAISILDSLRNKGLKVALDDFGTGYSSLNYLSRLPLDKIKVDKSFVHRLEDDTASRAITEAIIALGRTLNLEIVAEGIESAPVMDYLRRHGCHQAQGFFVCRPILGSDFASWYRDHDNPGPSYH